MARTKREERSAELLRFESELRTIFPKGATVYTVLRHATPMRRSISPLAISLRGQRLQINDWSWKVAKVLGWRTDAKRAGIVVEGCGMDMGYHLAHTLAACLYGDGYALKHEWI